MDSSLRLSFGAIALCPLLLAVAACGDRPAEVDAPKSAEVGPAAAPVIATDAAPAATTSPRPVRADGAFRALRIVDNGFGTPVTAMTAEVPADWAERGGISWNLGAPCLSDRVAPDWSASSPDGRVSVALVPGIAWQLAGYEIPANPCLVAPVDSVRGYLEAMVRRFRPGSTILGYRDRPDLVAEVEAASPSTPPPQGMRSFRQAGEIGIAFAAGGTPMRENLSAVATFTEVSRPGGRPSRMGQVGRAFLVRAPQGEEVGPVAERIRKSIKPDPEWQRRLDLWARETADREGAAQSAAISRWHDRRMAEISAKGAADRAAIRSQTARDVAAINSAGWQSRQDSLDRMHRNNVDTIREVNRYADPTSGRQVELSSHYNHGFRTGSGAYVATDDPNFNPGVNGQEMQRVR